MRVEVFAAGTHFHADPKGAGELVEMLLRKAANATVDHQMTLLIPDGSGYSAKNLFEQLKGCQKSISRNWRQETRKQVPEVAQPTAPPEPVHSIPVVRPEPKEEVVVIAAPAEEAAVDEPGRPDFATLQGICKYEAKLRYVLGKVLAITSSNHNIRKKSDFVEALQAACRWEDHLPQAVSRVMTELHKYDYVSELRGHHNKLIGYELTNRGLKVIGQAAEKPAVPPPAPPVDFGALVRQFADRAQELADVGRRLEAIDQERQRKREELQKLDEEYDRLSKIIDRKSVPQAIQQIIANLEVTPPRVS